MLLILWKLNNLKMTTILRLLQPKFLLVLVCTLFLFTRLYKIGEIPVSVYWDEASIGYNAYSIAETGKDEWGKFFPIHFRAFGEFKLPVYIYATAISVKLFGLNEFSVRLPAILFSLGVVILTYFLARKLSGNEMVGLFSSFFVSLSPWFFIFSRTGYEATVGLMFYLLGIWLFLHQKDGKLFLLSMAGFIISAYSYNSFRVIIPLTLLILIFYKRDEIKKLFKRELIYIILGGMMVILSAIPIFRLYKYDAGIVRFQAVSATGVSFIKNYFSHFNPDFLFLHGDKNLRNQQSGFGQLYWPDLILLPLGFLYIIRSKQKYKFLTLLLLLLGPIPAAITKESPHALRALSMVPFIAIISAEGVLSIRQFTRRRFLLSAVIIVIFLSFFIRYFLDFLNIYPVQSSEDWQYGYKKIFTDYKDKFPKYDQVIISDEYAQPYIFALFYQKIDPDKFRKEVVRNSVDQWGFSTVSSFDNFKFGKVDRLLSLKSGHSLIFSNNEEKGLNLTLLGTIKFLNGDDAFWVYEQ